MKCKACNGCFEFKQLKDNNVYLWCRVCNKYYKRGKLTDPNDAQTREMIDVTATLKKKGLV